MDASVASIHPHPIPGAVLLEARGLCASERPCRQEMGQLFDISLGVGIAHTLPRR